MINDYSNHWIPSNGYTYISNGTVWTDGIYLGVRDSISNWYDTNTEPPEPEEEETEESATAEEYDEQLERLGVTK